MFSSRDVTFFRSRDVGHFWKALAMSQARTTFPFSQQNSLNTLEAMESHLEADAEGWVLTASFSDAQLGIWGGKRTLQVTARFSSELTSYFFTFSDLM